MIELQLRVGLVVNPYAGVGGALALKGSDGEAIKRQVIADQSPLPALNRARAFIQVLGENEWSRDRLHFICVPGLMGDAALVGSPFSVDILSMDVPRSSDASHTRSVVQRLLQAGVDLLVFVGGDGTARDVCSVVDSQQLVLGVPAGVKMHSGVFAVNPQGAAELLRHWLRGDLINVQAQEVRDIDEEAFRNGLVRSRYYGEMMTPQYGAFLQAVKQGGFELEELVLLDIAEDLQQRLPSDALVVLGPGSTTRSIAEYWGQAGTLLGVDLYKDFQCLQCDVDASAVERAVAEHREPVFIVVTAIGGQGHIIGRGNQQISADVLRTVGRDNLVVVTTKTKLSSLRGRPLLMDSGDAQLDTEWAGTVQVITGYQELVAYKLGIDNDA